MAFKTDRQRKAAMARIHGKAQVKMPKVPVTHFAVDFVHAEFMNEDSDSDNIWTWKPGQVLTRFTDGSMWTVVKVDRYPGCNVALRPLDRPLKSRIIAV